LNWAGYELPCMPERPACQAAACIWQGPKNVQSWKLMQLYNLLSELHAQRAVCPAQTCTLNMAPLSPHVSGMLEFSTPPQV